MLRVPRAHRAGDPNMLEGQEHFPKGGGPEQRLPGCIGADWVLFSGVVAIVPMEPSMTRNCYAELRSTLRSPASLQHICLFH